MEIIVILLIIGASVAVESMLYRKQGAKKLSYTAALAENEVFEGQEAVLTEVLSNDKRLPLPFIKTEIVAPICLDFGVKSAKSKDQLCYNPSVFSLKGKEQCTRVRKIKCTRRGVFEIGSSSLYGGDLFGLSGFTMLTDQKEQLVVLPTPLDKDDFYPSSRLLYGDIQVRRFICEDPFLISGAHEYTGREPMNSIFWNGTARSGRLMALNRDFTTCSRILILLTFQRREEMPIAATDPVCEALIKAAAFALDQAVKNKSEFALAINLPDEGIPVTKSGEDHRMEQLRRLAYLKTDCHLSVIDFMKRQRLDEYTDIVLITPFFSQSASDFLKERQIMGQGVKVMSTRNEAEDEDFFIQITRAAQ